MMLMLLTHDDADGYNVTGRGLEGRPDVRDVLHRQSHPHVRRRGGVPTTDLHRYVMVAILTWYLYSYYAMAVLMCCSLLGVLLWCLYGVSVLP